MKLSTREKEVIQLLIQGYTNLEISKALFISRDTAKAHISSCIRKFSARNRTNLAYILGCMKGRNTTPEIFKI